MKYPKGLGWRMKRMDATYPCKTPYQFEVDSQKIRNFLSQTVKNVLDEKLKITSRPGTIVTDYLEWKKFMPDFYPEVYENRLNLAKELRALRKPKNLKVEEKEYILETTLDLA